MSPACALLSDRERAGEEVDTAHPQPGDLAPAKSEDSAKVHHRAVPGGMRVGQRRKAIGGEHRAGERLDRGEFDRPTWGPADVVGGDRVVEN